MSDSFLTPWTLTHQASLSTGFPRQEYWSGWSLPSHREPLTQLFGLCSTHAAASLLNTDISEGSVQRNASFSKKMKYQQHLNKVLRTKAGHNLPESHPHHHGNYFHFHVLNICPGLWILTCEMVADSMVRIVYEHLIINAFCVATIFIIIILTASIIPLRVKAP